MGYAIAEAAAARGCAVTLVSGPTELPTPRGVRRVDVVSALEMLDAARLAFAGCDVAFFVAAVADHRPAHRAIGKPAKSEGPVMLELLPNPDLAATLGAHKGRRVAVGFALEAAASEPHVRLGGVGLGDNRLEDLEPGDVAEAGAVERARAKLRRKHFDLCVLNAPAALAREESLVVLLGADGSLETLPRQSKTATAAVVVERALALWASREDRS